MFIVPTAVFVGAILTVIVVGLLRSEPRSHRGRRGHARRSLHAPVGVLLLLKAFANGCAALTGVEAIANAVPVLPDSRAVRRAQRAEVALGALLGAMLIGLAVLIGSSTIQPSTGVTVLAQLTDASLGHGLGYSTWCSSRPWCCSRWPRTPPSAACRCWLRLLARDNYLPHVFALRADRQVYRHGVLSWPWSRAVLLIVSGGDMNTLVPLFAIGVFVGFTLSQAGMVRHWLARRGPPGGAARRCSTASARCSPASPRSWSPPRSSPRAPG